ncbi:MAG TPA: DUF202 domain-containing protein [Mycobacterium sp.]|jgi:uncharacterized membrane protein YidH (DUF202 family)|nr:DUF202 domain-containing protein [Mycobacterium sp.]
MTRQALAQDWGLQPERTVLAWTRTALAASTSSVVLLLRDRDVVNLLHDPARLVVGGLAVVVAMGASGLGLRRRRELAVNPLPPFARARRKIMTVGVAVVFLSVLVVVYLLIVCG